MNKPEHSPPNTKLPYLISVFVAVAVLGLAVYVYHISRREPNRLAYWLEKAASRDWRAEAEHGSAGAELCVGLNLVRTNLVMMIDRIPQLSSVPVIGPRYFEKRHYSLDNKLSPDQLASAYFWIKKAAEQGFAPAKEAENLFAGKMATSGTGAKTNRNSQ